MTQAQQERLSWILTRRSTRRYLKKEVPQEALEAVVEAGRHAPSGGNNQTTTFFVIRDGAILERLAAEVCEDRKSTRLNSSHNVASRMPSSA